jgi:TP901 family phage tail tape measure protein
MADDTSSLGLGVVVTAAVESALAALNQLETKLQSLVTGMDKVTSSFTKAANEQIKSQQKIAESINQSAKAMDANAASVAKSSAAATKSTEALAGASKKVKIANEALGISYKEATKQMEGLGASQRSTIYRTLQSQEMFKAVVSTLKKFSGASSEAKAAIVSMTKSSDNNVVSFKQMTKNLYDVEKSILKTADSMKSMGASTKEINAFSKGVDRIAASTAFMKGEFYKTNTVLLSATKSYEGLNKETEILATKYQKLLNSNTTYAQKASEVIEKTKTATGGFRLYDAQLSQINKDFAEYTKQLDKWTSASTKAAESSKAAATQVSKLNGYLSQGLITHKEANTQLAEYLKTVKATGPEVGKFGQFLAGLHSRFTGMAATIKNTTGYFFDLGRALVSMATWIPAAIIISSITTAITEAIASISDFNQALKNLQAISGGTEAEIALLGEEILNISKTTKYSASEISKGAVYIAQAGFSAAESLDVIKAAALGAQGTLEPLTTAADLLTTVIRAFRLDASEASYIMDSLAVAANGSKTNLEGMRTVFNYIGPSAEAAGVSLNQALGAVMALSNAGIKMSTIGTSLRQVFIGLENQNAKLRAAINQAGLSANDFNVKFQNLATNGNGLAVVLKNLNTVIGGDLTKATQFFNVRANNTALVLSTMHEYVAILTEDTKKYGVAQAMAATQLDTISGKMSILSNRFKAMIISFSEGGLTEVFKGLITVLTKVIDLIDAGLNNALIKTTVTVTATVAALGLLAVVLGKIANYLKLVALWSTFTKAIQLGKAAIIAYSAATGAATTAMTALRGGLMGLFTLVRAHPIGLFATAVGALIVGLVNWKQSMDGASGALQKQVITNSNAATSATSLAEKLRDLAKQQAEGKDVTQSYLAIMDKIGEQFPELTDAMIENSNQYEKQAQLLDEQAQKSRETAAAKAEEVVALFNEKAALEARMTPAREMLGLNKKISESNRELWESAKEVASSIATLEKSEQQRVIAGLTASEKFKKIIQAEVTMANYRKEALVANDKDLVKQEATLLDTMGENWEKYYDAQSSPEKQAALLKIFQAGLRARLEAEKNYEKATEASKQTFEEKERVGLAAQNAKIAELIGKREKIYEKETAALKKETENQLKIQKKALDMRLSYLELEEAEAIANAREREETTENAEQAEYNIKEEYAKKKIDLINENFDTEMSIIDKGFQKRKDLIDKESLYLEESDGRKAEYLENEKMRSEEIISLYEDQLKAYESMASKEIAAMSKLESSIKSHKEKIKSTQKELEKVYLDTANKKLAANKLTMTSDEQMAADTKYQQELMAAGYKQLYAGNIDAAKDYFSKAGDMIDSLTVKTTDVFGVESESAKDTQKLRLGLIDEYEGAMEAAAKKQIDLSATTASKQQEDLEKAKNNLANYKAEIDKLQTALTKEIKMNIDTVAALDKITEVKNSAKEGAELVLKFMAEASPKDTLDNTITKVKAKIAELKSSLTTENFGQFVVKFIGTEDGVTFSPLLTVINSLKNNLHNWSLSLTASVSNFLIQILGNDGSGQAFINTIIANVQSKFAALTSELSKGATYTITIKTVKVGSSESSGGSGSSGGSDSGGGAAPVQEAEGGLIPGTGDGDTVPALLTPGEFVIRKGVVQTLGEGFFRAVNSLKSFTAPKFNLAAVPAFASGGLVRSVDQGTFTLNLAVGNSSIPLKVVGNPNTMRTQIKRLEKELSKMRLSKK